MGAGVEAGVEDKKAGEPHYVTSTRISLLRVIVASVLLHIMLFWPSLFPTLSLDSFQGGKPMLASLRSTSSGAGANVTATSPINSSNPQATPTPAIKKITLANPLSTPQKVVSAENLSPSKAAPQAAEQRTEQRTEQRQSPTTEPSLDHVGEPGRERLSDQSSINDVVKKTEINIDAELIKGYRMSVSRLALARKRYPPLALERGWEGTTEVRFSILKTGRAGQVVVSKSSGYAALDKEALKMVTYAVENTPLPDVLRGRSFAVPSLEVVFSVRE